MKVERVERFGLEAPGAGRELDSPNDIADARNDSSLADLAACSVNSDLGHVSFRIDRPLDHQVAFDPRVGAQSLVVTGPRLVSMRDDDGANVRRSAPGFVRVSALPG
jgi:hypothetical protein